MYLLILVLPLMGCLISGLFSRYLGEESAIKISTGLVGLTSGISIYSLYEVGIVGNKVKLSIGDWVKSDMLLGSWGLLFDSLTVVMLVVITFISFMVHVYSIEYMNGDPYRSRFFSYLSMFTFCMVILVTSDNYVGLFCGWELVGLCSYLLISFWYTRIKGNKAAIQAMLVNRIGDLGLVLGIGLIYIECGSVEYETVFSLVPLIAEDPVSGKMLWIIGILLLIGCVGKSAQVGLHVWLPNAMEAPSPVSALLHAATMVTAGIFLLVRSSPLLEFGEESLWAISLIGGMTGLIGATIGLLQNDVKKVIAYSTASQLGYMVFACGSSGYGIGMFHLFNHAIFKALLFLSGGAVIHGMSDEQDIRKMGGLRRVMPYTYSMLLIGSLALMGFPFLTGYYSKDVILEVALARGLFAESEMGSYVGYWSYGLGVIGAFFTAFYSMRLLHIVFLSKSSGNRVVMENVHEVGFNMGFPLLILSVGSIIGGWLMRDMMIGLGSDFWGNAIYVSPERLSTIEGEFLPTGMKWLPVVVSLCGVISSWLLYSGYEIFSNGELATKGILYKLKMSKVGMRLYKLLNRKWYFDKVYGEWINQMVLVLGAKGTYGMIDKGLLELLGPKGVYKTVYGVGKNLSKFESGNMYHYSLVMIVSALILGLL